MLSAILFLNAFQNIDIFDVSKINELPPEQVGELVLKGKNQRKIVSIKRDTGHLIAPNFIIYYMREEPVAKNNICIKIIWEVKFFLDPEISNQSYILDDTSAREYVALAKSNDCETENYVSRDQKIDQDQAIEFLKSYDDIALKKIKAYFICETINDDDLCDKKSNIRSAMRTSSPWHIKYDRDYVQYYINEAGKTSLSVKYLPNEPDIVFIERKIPAPF